MSKKKSGRAVPVSQPLPPQIFEATLGPGGSVIRGNPISQAWAETLRASGRDIVVCGSSLAENRRLARTIEQNDCITLLVSRPKFHYFALGGFGLMALP
jgi:hypothetical protein